MKPDRLFAAKLEKRLNAKADELPKYAGVIGDGYGRVFYGSSKTSVYVRVGNQISVAICTRVQPFDGMAVWVGFANEERTLYQVLSARATDTKNTTAANGYAPANRYRYMAKGGGQDVLWLEQRAWLPLRIGAAGGMIVNLYEGYIWTGTGFMWIESDASIDLTSHIPATSGKAAWVLLTVSTAGAIVETKGSEVDLADLCPDGDELSELPAVPSGTVECLAAIRVYEGQTEIREGRATLDNTGAGFTDLIDLRGIYSASQNLETVFYENWYPHRWMPDLVWEYATVDIVSTTKLKITLTANSNLGYYWRGERKDLGAAILEVISTDDKAEGIWYCYTRDGVTFELNQTPFYIWDIVSGARRADLMAWEFYWDNTNNTTLWIQPEFHAMLNPALHGYAHESFGTRYSNGLDITYGTTASNNDTRLKFTSGEIHDEDISAYITHAASPDDIWEQILGSAGVADANFAALPIYYLSGATPVWRKQTANSYPFRPVSNNYIYYNRLNAGSYDYTTGISINNYVVYWVVGTTNQTEPVVIIPGRQDNATLTAAQAEAFPNLSGLFTEYKLLYRIIYRGLAANTNNGKCQIIAVTDYRRDNISNNAVSSGTISAALVSFTPTGSISATNVQAAIEEVASEASGSIEPLQRIWLEL